MFPFIARFALVMVAGEAISRMFRHPRLAPLARSRTGRLALIVLGFGMRRHRKTRFAGKLVRSIFRRPIVA